MHSACFVGYTLYIPMRQFTMSMLKIIVMFLLWIPFKLPNLKETLCEMANQRNHYYYCQHTQRHMLMCKHSSISLEWYLTMTVLDWCDMTWQQTHRAQALLILMLHAYECTCVPQPKTEHFYLFQIAPLDHYCVTTSSSMPSLLCVLLLFHDMTR